MSHIHIALVGGQVYPIYLTIAALEPDRVILLHSEQSSAEAERLKAEVEAGVKADVEMRTVDPVNLQLISESFKSLFADIPGDAQCTVNLTGGTKPWSVLLYQIFQKRKKFHFSMLTKTISSTILSRCRSIHQYLSTWICFSD